MLVCRFGVLFDPGNLHADDLQDSNLCDCTFHLLSWMIDSNFIEQGYHRCHHPSVCPPDMLLNLSILTTSQYFWATSVAESVNLINFAVLCFLIFIGL